MKHGRTFFAFATSGLLAMTASGERDAEACGGCFVQNESTVVTDHRMALSISTEQTVLWDQIRYSGDPREFAWVLPVRAGTVLQIANDEFFTALDAATQPVVVPPPRVGGGVGCALAGCGSSAADGSGAPGPGQVQLISQAVVGPYETVTLRATDPSALSQWLRSHAFAIPRNIEPTIVAYVSEGFDFIALRLVPQCGERQMRPVRVVTRGADPTLPLRMVAAGVGARVGITLYVIGEGRYHPQNFPDAHVDWDAELAWDRSRNRSNYQQLSEDAMAQRGGTAWLTEFAGPVDVFPGSRRRQSSSFNPALYDAYTGLCRGRGVAVPSGSATGAPGVPPCVPRPVEDAGVDAQKPRDAAPRDAAGDAGADAGESDAGESDAGESDAGESDAAAADASKEPVPDAAPPVFSAPCDYLDDLAVATQGMRASDVWVTRLRAILPVNALSVGDLRLEAPVDQSPVSNVHYTEQFVDEVSPQRRAGCASAPKERTTFGSWVLAGLAAFVGMSWVRRRTRR